MTQLVPCSADTTRELLRPARTVPPSSRNVGATLGYLEEERVRRPGIGDRLLRRCR